MRLRIAAGLAVLAGLLALTELIVPRQAERRLRADLSESGRVREVDVKAFPAIKLLFGRADRIEVRLAETRLAGGRLADLLARARNTGELDARADVMRVGPLLVRDARLAKGGDRLHAEAVVSQADLQAALPSTFGLRPVESGADGLVLEASAAGIAVRARLSARDGALVIAPDGLLSALATLTLFEDSRVAVTGVGARPRPDGFTLTAEARLPAT